MHSVQPVLHGQLANNNNIFLLNAGVHVCIYSSGVTVTLF